MIQRSADALRRIDLLKLVERLGQRERAAAYPVDTPLEQDAEQLLLFKAVDLYEAG